MSKLPIAAVPTVIAADEHDIMVGDVILVIDDRNGTVGAITDPW